MPCTIRGRFPGPRSLAWGGVLALAALSASGSEACAQQQDNILKQAFKVLGFATDTPPPAGFVTKTRPAGDLDYIPVFQPPPEPKRPLMKSDRLNAIRSDLNAVDKRDDALRQAFPPAAKAMAEERAAQKKPNGSAAQ